MKIPRAKKKRKKKKGPVVEVPVKKHRRTVPKGETTVKRHRRKIQQKQIPIELRKGRLTQLAMKYGYISADQIFNDIPHSKMDDLVRDLHFKEGLSEAEINGMLQIQVTYRKNDTSPEAKEFTQQMKAGQKELKKIPNKSKIKKSESKISNMRKQKEEIEKTIQQIVDPQERQLWKQQLEKFENSFKQLEEELGKVETTKVYEVIQKQITSFQMNLTSFGKIMEIKAKDLQELKRDLKQEKQNYQKIREELSVIEAMEFDYPKEIIQGVRKDLRESREKLKHLEDTIKERKKSKKKGNPHNPKPQTTKYPESIPERFGRKASLKSFKEEWIKTFGKPKTDSEKKFLASKKAGIFDFYDDYTHSTKTLKDYMRGITED